MASSITSQSIRYTAFRGTTPITLKRRAHAERPNPTLAQRRRKDRKLSPEARLARFDQLFNFVSVRLGYRPAVKTPQIRQSAWIQLFGLATTPEQLQKVVELFPRWRDSRKEFNTQHAEMFVRRCEELESPTLALKVFGDHSQYGMSLSLPAARHLLHSLHVNQPLEDVATAAALYRVYNLPEISEDLVSCSTLASACFKHGTRPSLRVANALIPHLKDLLTRTEPVPVPVERAMAWLKWTLAKIEKALAKQDENQDVDWLTMWRRRSGHIPETQS